MMSNEAYSSHKSAFVVMPFAEEFTIVYKDAIHSALIAGGFEALRAPDLREHRDIMTRIYHGIWLSRVVIADLSGLNPNVLYELGIASALNKQVLIVTQNVSELPFDLANDWVVEYTIDPDGLDELRSKLTSELERIERAHWASTPIWKGKLNADILPVPALTFLESRVRRQAWIIEPRESFQDEAFHSAILDNLDRGIQYWFIVADRRDIARSFASTLGRHYGVNAHVKYVPEDKLPLPIAMTLFDACAADEHGYQYFPNGVTAFGVPLTSDQLARARQLFISIWEGPDGHIVGQTSVPV